MQKPWNLKCHIQLWESFEFIWWRYV
jgi:hypothetical protein